MTYEEVAQLAQDLRPLVSKHCMKSYKKRKSNQHERSRQAVKQFISEEAEEVDPEDEMDDDDDDDEDEESDEANGDDDEDHGENSSDSESDSVIVQSGPEDEGEGSD